MRVRAFIFYIYYMWYCWCS